MDIFQLVGDLLHLIAVIMLVLKILASRNVIGNSEVYSGLSYRTQQVYLVVFLSRYIDIFTGWISLYVFVMKVLFIGITAYTIYLMRFKHPFYISYDPKEDPFPHVYLYVGALLFAMVIHKSFDPFSLLWSFSIWLEAFAILPQLYIIHKQPEVENITAHYVLFLGLYRGLYIIHWIYHENFVLTSFLAGILQTVFYADFIWYFIKAKKEANKIKLPH